MGPNSPISKTNAGPKGDNESSLVHLYLFVGCLNFVLPRGKQKCFQREERQRGKERERGGGEGGIVLQKSGLNLDWDLIPSPISLWFPKSLTRNFPSVNLLKSPLMFLHLLLLLSVAFMHACMWIFHMHSATLLHEEQLLSNYRKCLLWG